MREVAVIGVGMHRFGRFPEKSFGDLATHALRQAVSDADVDWRRDIQAVYAGSMYFGAGWGNCIVWQMGLTGVPVVNVEAACATGGVAFSLAYQAVATGVYDIVCAVGAEKQPRGIISLPRHHLWQRRMGLVAGPAHHAWEAQRHMHLYGTTPAQLALVSVQSHKNASLCPNAHYQNNADLTVEDVLNSRMIADPLTIYQLCPTSEGAAAAVLCAKDKIPKQRAGRRTVTVAACVATSGRYNRDDVALGAPYPSTARLASRKVYEAAGIGPGDLGVVECRSAATGEEIWAYEGLGLCPEGEGGRFVEEGHTRIGGKIPVNTDGGHISRGNPMGAAALAEVAEVVWQLRGEAGPRQVQGAKAGLVDAFGDGPNCVEIMLKV